ncbi:alpha/beta hydrolase [Mucilaginibacter robiniae]|uniref:Alpha/beta hydrolase n=1 Tax=Mucilaginibacter robiniae TaxID=2728022 RepID=A0A7L5EC64_9SPHI|nr:alpha/beta hydrolase [Mucilaginibacter robiniae]QJD97996.1 alpha/beta hydrolase [Mucilaginibacter robiniae]
MKFVRIFLTILAYIFVIAGIILTGLYRWNNKEKKDLTDADRKQAGGQYIKLSQGITHYQLGGPATGKVVVLIHGFSVPYYIWDGTYEYLTAQGFRVLRYDEYGRGFSDRPDITYNHQVYMQQLNELLTNLHLQAPVNLVGVSFGGKVARDFTCQYPQLVNKVVLIDPAYSKMKPNTPELITDYQFTIHSDKRAESQVEDFKYPNRHPDWVSKYKTQMQYKGFTHALVSTLYNYPSEGKAESICLNNTHKPTLLIWGKEDHTVPFQYSDSVRSVLKATFLPVDDAGHLPYLEQAATVNPKIAAFLKD